MNSSQYEEKVGTSTPPNHADLTPTPVAPAAAPEPSRAPSSRQVSESPATTSAPAPEQPSAEPAAVARSASSAAGGLKEVLGEIRGMLQAQSKQIESLTNEVADLKARLN